MYDAILLVNALNRFSLKNKEEVNETGGVTTAGYRAELPSFRWASCEAPWSGVSIWVSAVVVLKILLRKSS